MQSKSSTILLATKWSREVQLSAIFDTKRFRIWTKLLRVTALVRKFIAVLGNRGIERVRELLLLLQMLHHVADMIILHRHSFVSHNGTNETLAELRQNYWLPRGRQLVGKLIHTCRICKWYKGIGYEIRKLADLPEGRVQGPTAFADIGIDFASSLYVKSEGDLQKTYFCIFTYSASRAVHLQTMPNLSTAALIHCLKRFIARRGLPNRITSGNAKTFKKANKEIWRILKDAEVQGYITQRNIVWKFILERAPWFGRFCERMVQMVKQPLRKILGNATLNCVKLKEDRTDEARRREKQQ